MVYIIYILQISIFNPIETVYSIYFSLQLLDFEPRAGQQVPLLMKMHKDNIALSKAIESGDTDLGISEYVQIRLET